MRATAITTAITLTTTIKSALTASAEIFTISHVVIVFSYTIFMAYLFNLLCQFLTPKLTHISFHTQSDSIPRNQHHKYRLRKELLEGRKSKRINDAEQTVSFGFSARR